MKGKNKKHSDVHPSHQAQIDKHANNAEVYQADIDLLEEIEKKKRAKAKRKKDDEEN
jgi:hypothetical protein